VFAVRHTMAGRGEAGERQVGARAIERVHRRNSDRN